MDDQGQEQPSTLAEVTVLANQAITDLNALITDNGSDPTGNLSLTQLQAVMNDCVQIRNILTAFVQSQLTGA